jgi:hypothetical protein
MGEGIVLCNMNSFALEVARFTALFLHYPDSSTSSLSFCGLKPIGVGEFFTSSPRPKGRGNKLWQLSYPKLTLQSTRPVPTQNFSFIIPRH